MRETRAELGIGESIRVGDRLLTVVDITDDDVTFRVEETDSWPSCGTATGFGELHDPSRGWPEFFRTDEYPDTEDKGPWPPR